MSDTSIAVKFGVDLSGLTAGLNEAQNAIKNSTDQMKAHMGGLVDGVGFVGKAFAGLAAIAGGGALFAAAIEGVKQVTGEAKMMGKILGTTTSEASIFNVALASVGASTDQAKTAILMMTRTLGTSPEKFERLGVATKNAAGELRPMSDILVDVNTKFAAMTDGTGKNLAMAAIFGRRWMDVGPVLGMTAEAMEKAREHAESLNLVVGEENERDTKRFKIGMSGLKEVMEGIQKTIGQAVMPLLTDLGEWFASIGPAAVSVTQYAIGGLVAALQGLKFVAVGVWEGLKTLIEGFATGIAMAVDMVDKAIHGDWAGARAAWKTGTDQIADIATANLKIVADEADKTANAINQLFSKQTATKKKSGSDAPDMGKPGADGTPQEKSQIGIWEAVNAADKAHYELSNNLKQRDLSEDVVFWNAKAAIANAANGDKLKALAKAAAAELALMKKSAADGRALSDEAINESEKAALAGLALTKEQYDSDLALGRINAAQLIQLEKDLEAQRNAIQVNAQQLRTQLVESDPNHSPVALQKEKDKLLDLERAHQMKLTQLKNAATLEDNKASLGFFKSMQTGVEGMLTGLMTGTKKMSDVFKDMFKSVWQAFAEMAAKIAAEWAMTALKNMLVSKTTNKAQVSSDAGAGAAAAYKSTAAIPIIGPMLAPIAAAVAYTGIMAFSAKGGFDIPAGLNPLTQLHEREMVLPAEHADVVRDLAANGGGRGDTHHWHIQALDGHSVRRVLMDNPDAFAAAAKKAQRNFAF